MSSYFYPRPPRGGRREVRPLDHIAFSISIHALREEGDMVQHRAVRFRKNFYPRPPRGGRPGTVRSPPLHRWISIHALREEGDPRTTAFRTTTTPNFYPRPPRGGRPIVQQQGGWGKLFLSTPSARRATAKTETKSLFSNKLYNILHEFGRALIYNGSKNYPNHAK